MSGVIDLLLERDGHDQPWGFRLQGGHDVGMPLSIQRILVGTPSEGVLKKGDVLVRISATDARGLTHQQAADLFTNTGNQIKIQFKRAGPTPAQGSSGGPSHPAVAPPRSVPVSGGVALPGMTQGSQGTNQDPYRTSPLIQPSAKIEVGPGSAQHLRMQSDYITGAKEVVDTRPTEFAMQQKVRGGTAQFKISIGSEGKTRGNENNKTEARISLIGLRFPLWKDMLKPPSPRNRRHMDAETKPKARKGMIDLSLLKKKSYKDMDTDSNNNSFKIGGEQVALKRTPKRLSKVIEPFRLPELRPLKKVDPKLLIKKKPKPLQVPKEYQDEQLPEYDRTEIKELNFVVEKTVLQKFEKKAAPTGTKRPKREKYVKEQLTKFKVEPPKEKKKKPEPVVVKKAWKRLEPPKEKKKKPEPVVVKKAWKRLEPKAEVKVEVPQPKVFKIKSRPVLKTKPKRFIKFEVRTTRKEEYVDEVTLMDPKEEMLKFKSVPEYQIVTFSINLKSPRMNTSSDDYSNQESVDVFETIKL